MYERSDIRNKQGNDQNLLKNENKAMSRMSGKERGKWSLAIAQYHADQDIEERLHESLGKIYAKDWQRGNIDSTAPHPSNITGSLRLLKVLRKSDWLKSLQEEGRFGVDERRTLQLISRMLKGIDPSNLGGVYPIGWGHRRLDLYRPYAYPRGSKTL